MAEATPPTVTPEALAREASRLYRVHLTPTPPLSDTLTPELRAWFERSEALSDQLGEMAGWDAELLTAARAALGVRPGVIYNYTKRPPGEHLLHVAATRARRMA